jgi:geranylgeranyl diphosphate synthase, type II
MPSATTEAGARLERLRGLVDEGLRELTLDSPGDLEPLAAAIRYPLLAGGKRLRPLLCLASAEACGLEAAQALPTALALELVHTFSLVHDDLPALDDDDLRRGRATTHVVYGEDVAILVGDALLNAAFTEVADRQPGSAESRLAVLSEIARAVGPRGMIGGQYLDVTAAVGIGEDELARLCRLKTGALIEASVACGALLAGAPAGLLAGLRTFAAELGLLFQLVDDVLDATGSDATLGKPAGSDERHGKATHVTVLGLERTRALAEDTRERALALLAEVDADTATLRALALKVADRDR